MKKLSLFALIMLPLATQSATAQEWKEYSFEGAGFAAQYPGQPKVEQRNYTSAFASPIVERVYSHNEGGVDYIVAIADFTKANAEEGKTIDEAANALIARGKLTHDEHGRIDFHYGREVRVEAPDGTSYTDAIFFINNRLFQIEVIYPAVNSDPAGSSGIHFFQQAFRLLN
jgi:hypothetical protein